MIVDEVLLPFLRSIAFFFDNIVYGLIAQVYELMLYLANMDLYTKNPWLQDLVQRIYVLLGIFMLFKLAFSVIQYLVDPNAFSDSSKGFGKLVTNTMVAMILLVSVPWIFETAYKVQGYVLENNAIGELIMGETFSSDKVSAKSLSQDVQFLMYGAFLSVNTDVDAFKECTDTPVMGSRAMAANQPCLEALEGEMAGSSTFADAKINLDSFFKKGADGDASSRKFEDFSALVAWRIDGQFAFNYMPVISALAGGYVAFLLLTFCIDVAIRIIKLCFLQMLAPISIISYMDPKESMGNSKLGNWIKECGKTYVSLFIRLVTIFLAMTLIQIIANTVLAQGGINDHINWTSSNIGTPDGVQTMFIYVLLVIGAFMFAKQVPQMIENLFGIKASGELTLNPFKNPVIAAGAGLTLGAIGGAMAGARAGLEAEAPIRGALVGMASGARRGMGSKLEKGMFGNTRNSVFRDLTGNDMRNYRLHQKFLGIGADKKIKEVSDPLKMAHGQLNEAQTNLNIASHETTERGRFLTDQKIDMHNLPEEMRRHSDRVSQLQANVTSLQSERSRLEQYKSSFQNIIDANDRELNKPGHIPPARRQKLEQAKRTAMDNIANADKRIADTNTRLNQSQSQLVAERQIVANIQGFEQSVKRENELREQIGSIEKDISTLSDAKSDRKKFYGIDDSTKQSISDAIGHVNQRQQGSPNNRPDINSRENIDGSISNNNNGTL